VKKSSLAPILLLAPLLLVMAVFLIGLTDGILQGLGYIPAFGMEKLSFDYFKEVLSNKNLLASIGISLYIAIISASVSTVLAVALCFALVTLKKDSGFLYAIIRFPMFFPWVVTGLTMIHLLSSGGWLARLFVRLGFGAVVFEKILYSSGQTGIIFAFVWACTPFACFLIQSVMSHISVTFGEAASNLGAALWRRFWFVTLPMCRPVIRNTFLILLLSCFGSYEIPVLLGMTIPRALPVEIYYQYSRGDLRQRPYAMALNTIMLAIALVLAGIILIVGKKREKNFTTENTELIGGKMRRGENR